VGGVLSTTHVLASLLAPLPPGLFGQLLYRPAIVTVPVAFLTMVIVSWMTRSQVCREVDDVLLRLHAPERLGLTQDRL
jgi:Na+(H+)/acetate symporter ActP